MKLEWNSTASLESTVFVCGYCDEKIGSAKGFTGKDRVTGRYTAIFICPICGGPSFFDADKQQYPGASYGSAVQYVPAEDITALYQEARHCMKVSSYTAAVLCLRKLLINIAVAQGAEQGQTFLNYVEYLSKAGYVPPNGKGWVDHIRQKGNEATHEIKIMTREDAEDLIRFAEMLLKFIYEFPGIVKQRTPGPA